MSQRLLYGALVALAITAVIATITSDGTVVASASIDEATPAATLDSTVHESPGTTESELVRPPTTPPATAPPTTEGTPEEVETTQVDAARDGWRLVWSDEFDFFDASKWGVERSTYGHGNAELQCYRSQNVVVEEGLLRLVAERASATCPQNERRDYSSGMLRTEGLAEWTYGRFEVRARLPDGQGFWPAAWLSPSASRYGQWPRSGELDIVESLGSSNDRIVGSMHWMGARGHELSNREFFLPAGQRFADGFHTFAVEWEPGQIVWFIDDEEYHRVTNWASTVGDQPAPFDQPFYLKLNLAVGGGAAGTPTDETPFPASYDIDWVRVYQH